MKSDGSAIAVGDEYGKIYHIMNTNCGKGQDNIVIQTLHWHAHKIDSLCFVENTPFLMSGGSETVLVQWHLEKQEKTFVSRLGSGIDAVALSDDFYGLLLKDNTFRVVRMDNNKIALTHQNPSFNECERLQAQSNLLMVPEGGQL